LILLGSGVYLFLSIKYLSQNDLFIATLFFLITVLVTGQSFEIITVDFTSVFSNLNKQNLEKTEKSNVDLSGECLQKNTLNVTVENVAISIILDEENNQNSNLRGWTILSFGAIVIIMPLFGCGGGSHNNDVHREASIALGFKHPVLPEVFEQPVEQISEEEIYRLLGLDYPVKNNNSNNEFSQNGIPTANIHSEMLTSVQDETLVLEEDEYEEVGDAKCVDLSLLPPCFSCLWCLRAYLSCFLIWGAGIIGAHYYVQRL